VVDSFFLTRTFVTLLVITDPVATVPVFTSMTTTASRHERNVATYRLRLLLYCGVRWQTHQVTGLRGHA
jgi:small neutral amino acid transporter SnatA (MarC family)